MKHEGIAKPFSYEERKRGHLRIGHVFSDKIAPSLHPIQFKIVYYILRMTDGWNVSKAKISTQDIIDFVGCSKPTAIKHLALLSDPDDPNRLVNRKRNYYNNNKGQRREKPSTFSMNPDYEINLIEGKEILPSNEIEGKEILPSNEIEGKETLPYSTKEKDIKERKEERKEKDSSSSTERTEKTTRDTEFARFFELFKELFPKNIYGMIPQVTDKQMFYGWFDENEHFREGWDTALRKAATIPFIVDKARFSPSWFLKTDYDGARWIKIANGDYDPFDGQRKNEQAEQDWKKLGLWIGANVKPKLPLRVVLAINYTFGDVHGMSKLSEKQFNGKRKAFIKYYNDQRERKSNG